MKLSFEVETETSIFPNAASFNNIGSLGSKNILWEIQVLKVKSSLVNTSPTHVEVAGEDHEINENGTNQYSCELANKKNQINDNVQPLVIKLANSNIDRKDEKKITSSDKSKVDWENDKIENIGVDEKKDDFRTINNETKSDNTYAMKINKETEKIKGKRHFDKQNKLNGNTEVISEKKVEMANSKFEENQDKIQAVNENIKDYEQISNEKGETFNNLLELNENVETVNIIHEKNYATLLEKIPEEEEIRKENEIPNQIHNSNGDNDEINSKKDLKGVQETGMYSEDEIKKNSSKIMEEKVKEDLANINSERNKIKDEKEETRKQADSSHCKVEDNLILPENNRNMVTLTSDKLLSIDEVSPSKDTNGIHNDTEYSKVVSKSSVIGENKREVMKQSHNTNITMTSRKTSGSFESKIASSIQVKKVTPVNDVIGTNLNKVNSEQTKFERKNINTRSLSKQCNIIEENENNSTSTQQKSSNSVLQVRKKSSVIMKKSPGRGRKISRDGDYIVFEENCGDENVQKFQLGAYDLERLIELGF